MNRRAIRVLVVDDSAFARKVVREVLSSAEIEVVGTARDGLEALEQIAALKPDVLTLDLMMPNLDGVGVLKALPAENRPRVVVVSMSGAESALGIEALLNGAVDIVQKPTALATERLYELGAELRAKVLAAAGAQLPTAAQARIEPPLPEASGNQIYVDLVVIGTSTGGPQALTRLLAGLPVDCAPVGIALHIPEGYTQGLAQRLDARGPLRVREAADGMPFEPGVVLLAPGGKHMRVERRGGALVASLTSDNEARLYTPSVDLLFESAATQVQDRALGVVLTGMGTDGLAGAGVLRANGARVLVESESSCVVYGMPRAIQEAGLATGETTLEAMAAMIDRTIRRPGKRP
ncbi:MAG TPA: chemotaxis-specific protein-glutamate methyltransferase CheB [Polyangia bacterium]